MMCFTTLMQILMQTFCWLYSFVTSIASIKAGIAFVVFISVFMVLVPINATHTKFETGRDIQNTESEDDIKYAAQSAIYIDNSLLEKQIWCILGFVIGMLIICLICFGLLKFLGTRYGHNLIIRFLRYFNIVPNRMRHIRNDDHQQNHYQNNIRMFMTGDTFQYPLVHEL